MNLLAPFSALRNPHFARLYAAQAVSQIGDALTWVGLALLAYQLAPENAPVVLGTALTLRVAAFVLFSPLAGVIADRVNRKLLLAAMHFGRMLVIGLMPFVTDVWQVYLLMFALNSLTAFFTPTNQATVPLVVGREDATPAFALSSATTELLGILGPALAGVLAAFVGSRNLFFFDAATFLIAGALILTLPALKAQQGEVQGSTWTDVKDGTTRLWRDPPVRYALLLELVAAVTGALILVQTVTRVQGGLALGEAHYGWVMAAFGLGATLASLVVGATARHVARTTFIGIGALVTSLAILPGDAVGFAPLLALWLVAGVGQNWVNLPTEALLAERTDESAQGRVYGAHFAWSHLWWAFTYPLAAFLGREFESRAFLYGGLIALAVLLAVQLTHARRVGERGPHENPQA